MLLDDAVSRFVSAYTEYLEAKENLKQALLKVGASKRTTENFIKNLEDGIRLGKLEKHSTQKPTPKPDAERPNGNNKVSGKEEPPNPQQNDSNTPLDKWELKDKLKEWEFVTDGKHYFYKLDGKVYKRRALPLVEYGNVRLFFSEFTGSFYMRSMEGRGASRLVGEKVAISWTRDIMKKLELDEINPDSVIIYEPFVKAMLPKMRPLARDALRELFNTWKAKGGGVD